MSKFSHLRAIADPTKRFFVSSLTRDISAQDAILDLIDNSIDGILRQNPPQNGDQHDYSGYAINLSLLNDTFAISDNCGGIPLDVATKNAFRFGRDEDADKFDEGIATVGMYGIGMKRAIFKLGTEAEVIVQSKIDSKEFVVRIPENWLDQPTDWSFPLKVTNESVSLDSGGTTVKVMNLHKSIKREFNEDESQFISELKDIVGQFFAMVIDNGLVITINDEKIRPAHLGMLTSRNTEADYHPYYYLGQIEDVQIKIAIGFYAPLAGVTATVEDPVLATRERKKAGITVICNDRIVLYKDKSRITGWGQSPVPSFHNQFISITGIIMFTSEKPLQLPVTTTKRDLDTSSDVYWNAVEFAKKGLKKFTDFTNHWKGNEDKTESMFNSLTKKNTIKVLKSIESSSLRAVPNRDKEFQSVVKLPKPTVERSTRRISFSKDYKDIELVSEYLGHDTVSPSKVGESCFDAIYNQAVED